MCFWLILLAAGTNAQLQSLVGVIFEVVDALGVNNSFQKGVGGVLCES